MTCTAPCKGAGITERATLDGLREQWNALLGRSYDNRLFLTYDWLQTWLSSSEPVPVHLVSLEEDGRLLAILPLMLSNQAGTEVALLGDPEVMDYMDGLADRGEAQRLLAELWRHVFDSGARYFSARHVPSGSPLIASIERLASDLNLDVTVENDEVCPVAILCNTWDGYLETLTKKQRHEIRRKIRRAQSGAEWEWRTAHTGADVERDMPVFFRLQAASASQKATFLTDEMRTFFRRIAEQSLEHGILRLSVFKRDGVDIAATFSFLYRGRWLLYNSGYDPAYAAHSPGIAAVALAMQDAINEKAVAFDFLSGDESYKYQLGASNTHTCRVTAVRR